MDRPGLGHNTVESACDTARGRATIRRRKLRYAQQRARGALRYNALHSQPGLRQVQCWACETALCALPGRSARDLCVQSGFRVCTWCTQPSFRLSALFQSLFETLFTRFFKKKFEIKSFKMKFSKIKFLLLKII